MYSGNDLHIFVVIFKTCIEILNKFCENVQRFSISLHGYTYRRYCIILVLALPHNNVIVIFI